MRCCTESASYELQDIKSITLELVLLTGLNIHMQVQATISQSRFLTPQSSV